MKLILNDNKKETIQLELTHQEVRNLRHGLGEMSSENHIEDFEFHARLGCTKDEMWEMVEGIIKIMDDEDIEL